jgi:cell division septum initiation protein DivIVA
MGNDFKRSFIGYDTKEVAETIKALELEYEKNLNALENKLASLENENNSLKIKISGIKEDLIYIKKIENEIIEFLFNSHIRSTESVYNAKLEAERSGIGKEQMIKEQQDKIESLKKSYVELIEDLKSKVSDYLNKLELY